MRNYIHIITHVTMLDLVLAAILIGLGIPELAAMPAFKRLVIGGSASARLWFYGAILAFEWLFSIAIAAVWFTHARPWDALLLGGAAPWRMALGFALAAPVLWLAMHNRRAVTKASAERLTRFREQAAGMEFFLPHTLAEYRIFGLLSVTAGICEEFIYRGFVMWVAANDVGMPAAVVLQAFIFALGHVYQGDDVASTCRAMLKTGMGGVLFAVIAIATGSLVPGMVLHALIDLSSGDVAYRAYAKPQARPAAGV